MKLSRFLVPALLLAGMIWTLGTVSARAGEKARTATLVDKQSYLLENREIKEYREIEERIRQGLPISDIEKGRFEALEWRYGQRQEHDRAIDNRGGPDEFGYSFVDNQGGDTATYDWIELRGDGSATWLTFGSHDDAVQSIPIGFTFPIYGNNYENVTVSTNGNLQFATTSTTFGNSCLPAVAFNGPTIMPFWDDLHQDYGGIQGGTNTIGYRSFGEYLVVEWDSVGHCCSAGSSYKFEAIIWADGRMKMQYNNLAFGANANSQTIGIQQSGTGTFLQYDCNAVGPQPVNNLAIWITAAESGSLHGVVRDDSNVPIMNATVHIENTNMNAQTDNLGEFTFPLVVVGTYDVTASRTGHESQTVQDVQINANETTNIQFSLTDLGLLTFVSPDVPVVIPETGTATSTLNIDTSVAILDLDVMINLEHTFDADITISLTSPEGITVVLSQNRGGGNDNYTNTIFDDEAPTPIANGTAPFTGTFRPEGTLSDFDDMSTLGTWTLTVVDGVFGDDGNILGWEIYVTPGNSEGGNISGVVSATGGAALAGARVALNGDPNETRMTDSEGRFAFSFLDAGTYSLEVTRCFFEQTTVNNIVVTNGANITVDVDMDSATYVPYAYTGDPVPIADFDSSFAVITVQEDFLVFDVAVVIGSLTHTFDGDMQIWVENPTGIRVMLSDRNGGGGDNFTNTLFSDCGETAIADGTPPFDGMFMPDEQLNSLGGFSAQGNWTLVVYDAAGGDIGTIDQWSVLLGGEIGPNGDLTGTIRSAANSLPIAGATVSIPNLGESATTNGLGEYTLSNVDAGTHSVLIHAAGYCDSTVGNIVITDGGVTTLNVGLRNPTASFSVTSISQTINPDGQEQSTFTISNNGSCPLQYSITDTSGWLSESPNSGNVLPGGQASISVNFDAAGLPAGTYTSRISVTHNANGSPYQIPVTLDVILAADDPSKLLPTTFALNGNFPNPFNSSTEISFDVPKAALLTLTLYNIIGQEVVTLVNQTVDAGRHTVSWDGKDARGLDSGTGIYLVRMTADGQSFTGKLMLLR